MLRRLAWGAAAGLVAATAGAVAATPAERLLVLEAADLAGSPVAPFRLSAGRPVVFVFATIDCPISNRYAPELQRLHDEFGRGDTSRHLTALPLPGAKQS